MNQDGRWGMIRGDKTMLVLSRFVNELFIVTLPDGRRMKIMLCEAKDGAARIGFDAPADVLINRKEVQERIDEETSMRSSWNDYRTGGHAEPAESH